MTGVKLRVRRALLATATAVALTAGAAAARAEARHAALVVDANSGAVLHAQAADEPRFPASLTKMMTLYMAFELIEAGRLGYQSKIKVSQEAAAAAPSKLDLDPGEEIVLIDAIRALVTKSANDMAIAVAEHIGGTEANFARLMTQKARALGMRSTTFRNASGLPDPGQVTTARDMVTLALRLNDDFPRHYKLFATRAFSYHGVTHRNHNTLLNSFAGTDGIKTGYTRASGFNLVSSVRRDGRHVVAAIFGGSTAASRNAQMRALLTRALPRAATERTRKPAPLLLAAQPRPAQRPAAVATAAPKPQPVPAAAPATRPAPQQPRLAAAAPAVHPAETAPARPVPAEPTPSAADGAREPDTRIGSDTPPPAPTIEVARVRRVMVTPRARPAAAAVPTDRTTEEPAGTEREAARPALPSPAADAPVGATETVLAKRAAEPRASPSAVADALPVEPAVARRPLAQPAPLPPLPPPAAVVAPVGTPAEPRMALGRAPSTLQQQAQALAPAPPVRLAAASASLPASVGAAARAPGYEIQVGAFASAAEAERQLAAVRSRAGALLADRTGLAIPVTKGARPLYRARFAGFSSNAAANACLELRRLAVDCFVMKAE